MKKTITIDPVTRIEGHAKVFLDFAESGEIENAGMVVNELRGFERILVGMKAEQMPLITARICGVCPSAHHLVASKALDAVAGVDPPPAAKLLRELLYMGHFIHSHTLSLFVLQGPDLVMGLNADPAVRNVVGVVNEAPDVAKKALRLRSIGQKINEMVGGRGIHPVTSVAGGITFRLTDEKKDKLKAWADEGLELVGELGEVAKSLLLKQLDAHPSLVEKWSIPSWYMGTVKNGKINFYDGMLRVMDPDGNIANEFEASNYKDHLAESVLDWSYMKPVQYKNGDDLELYRVNTLGRVNCAEGMETPIAQAELEAFRETFGRPCHLTIMHIYARLIELIYACEKAKELIHDPMIEGETLSEIKNMAGHGAAHVEAPRGALFHEYEIDEEGIVRKANLIVATQQNYLAINESIRQAAQTFVAGKNEEDAILNAVEFSIRCYDPCLSCATHAVGSMPLEIVLRKGGETIKTIRRRG